jgi:hypothetical protein
MKRKKSGADYLNTNVIPDAKAVYFLEQDIFRRRTRPPIRHLKNARQRNEVIIPWREDNITFEL